MKLRQRSRNSLNLFRRSRFHYYRMAMLRPPYWLTANGQTCRVFAGNNSGAASCYSEVVVQDCYGVFKYHKRANPLVIVDIGANIGVFSKLCSMLFPNADIYAYEPNPSSLRWLEQNARGTRIRAIEAAVGHQAGEVRFDASSDPTLSHLSEEGDLTVRCVAASEVAPGLPIDLLKMDCEGGEWQVLKDLSLLSRTKELCLEYHLVEGRTFDELVGLVEGAGHRIHSITRNEGNDKCGFLLSSLGVAVPGKH